jgi:hypothetical protein
MDLDGLKRQAENLLEGHGDEVDKAIAKAEELAKGQISGHDGQIDQVADRLRDFVGDHDKAGGASPPAAKAPGGGPRPAAKAAGRPGHKPAAKPAARPAAKQAGKQAGKPAKRHGGGPGGGPGGAGGRGRQGT